MSTRRRQLFVGAAPRLLRPVTQGAFQAGPAAKAASVAAAGGAAPTGIMRAPATRTGMVLPTALMDGDPHASNASTPTPSPLATLWLTFKSQRTAMIGLATILTLGVLCFGIVALLPWNAEQIDYEVLNSTPPSSAHPFGTDALGRDVLSRVLVAGQVSLTIGLAVAFISSALGAAVGIIAGYFGGRTDERMMWFVNILLTVPSLPLLIAMASVAQSEGSPAAEIMKSVSPTWRIVVVLSLLGWMGISRVVRSKVVSLRNQEFVEAARAMGASHWRIMMVHILPNTVSVLAVFATLAVSGAILAESALSFLGVGVTPPTPTWGNMLYEARDVFTATHYWWLTWVPAVFIVVTVLAVNVVGDGLRDAVDPHQTKR